jgi:PAS domain S-box-containing protein
MDEREAPGTGTDGTGRAGRRVPTTPVERWAEIVAASHDGMAIVGADCRIIEANERLAAALGSPAGGIVGTDLHDLVPELATRAPDLVARLGSGATVRLEVQRPESNAGRAWVQLTLVPRRSASGRLVGAVTLTRDVSELRRAQQRRLGAQRRLTAVEEEIRRRVSSELHDGPIQLLAALTLRLAAVEADESRSDELRSLGRSVDDANRDLRHLLGELTAPDDDPPAAVLSRWSAPLLEGTALRLAVDDRSSVPPDRATLQAMFVFLHEILGAIALVDRPREIRAVISGDREAQRLDVDVPDSRSRVLGHSASVPHIGAATQFAASLGASMTTEMIDDDVRRITVRIPAVGVATAARDGGEPLHRAIEPDTPTPRDEPEAWQLTEADWEAIAAGSHQGLIEVDGDLIVTSVNDRWATAMGRTVQDVLGRHFSELFDPHDYERLLPYVEMVRSGVPVRFDWRRRNALGEQRWTNVSASPRDDGSGGFAGALLLTIDTTELHLAHELGDAVTGEIDRARRGATLAVAERVRTGPLHQLLVVRDRLCELVGTDSTDDPLAQLASELTRSISRLEGSLERLGEPDVSDGDWPRAVRRHVSALLELVPSELTIVDETRLPLSSERAALLVRVAREAIANAVLHGRARSVVVTLSDVAGEHELRIDDDGVGFDRDTTDPVPGHLGLRSMYERAAEQHGELRIEPRAPGGTRVVVRLPSSGDLHPH